MSAPTAPTRDMLEALRAALFLERGPQAEPWVHHRSKRVRARLVLLGLAEAYTVVPGGEPYLRITDAGREAVSSS